MTSEIKQKCWEQIKLFAPKSISWSHYDLAAQTEVESVDIWKEFLLRRDVQEWIEQERMILQQAELSKLSTEVANSRSVGQAQLISTMQKINESNKANKAEGPAFVYCYVPLNPQQEHAPNVQILEEDIFYDKDAPKFN